MFKQNPKMNYPVKYHDSVHSDMIPYGVLFCWQKTL